MKNKCVTPITTNFEEVPQKKHLGHKIYSKYVKRFE